MMFFKGAKKLSVNKIEYIQYKILIILRKLFVFPIFLIEFYFYKRKLSLSPIIRLRYFLSKKYLDCFFYFFAYFIKNNKRKESNLVASIASIEERSESLSYAIKSLILQKSRPNKILIYTSKNTINSRFIRKDISIFNSFGVRFIDTDNKLGSHRKYIFLKKYNKKNFVVTFDDDMIYDKWLITDLLNHHYVSKAKVVDLYGWQVNWQKGKQYPEKRSKWKKELIYKNKNKSFKTYTNTAYTLFSPGSLPNSVFDKKNVINLCLNSSNKIVGYDDSWVKWNLVSNGIKVGYARRWGILTSQVEYKKVQINSLGAISIGIDSSDNAVKRIIKFLKINSNFKK